MSLKLKSNIEYGKVVWSCWLLYESLKKRFFHQFGLAHVHRQNLCLKGCGVSTGKTRANSFILISIFPVLHFAEYCSYQGAPQTRCEPRLKYCTNDDQSVSLCGRSQTINPVW